MNPALRSHPLRRLALLGVVPVVLLSSRLAPNKSEPRPAPAPLSKMDRVFRAEVGEVPWMFIGGGGPQWCQWIGSDFYHGIIVKDKRMMREVAESLRCSSEWQTSAPNRYYSPKALTIMIELPPHVPQPLHAHTPTLFFYHHISEDCYFETSDRPGGWGHQYWTQVRSAAHFENVVARLAARAKAPGNHPELKIVFDPFGV